MTIAFFRRASLYYRINAIIIGIILLLSMIIGALMIRTTRNLLERQMENRGKEIATFVGALSSNDILLEDHYALSSWINTTKSHTEDVRYIIITDFAGRLLIDTFSGKFPTGLPRNIERLAPRNPKGESSEEEIDSRIIRYRSSEGSICEVTVPIENGAVGFVRVGMSERSTQKLLASTIKRFLLITLLVSLLASAGATLLAHLIVKPIRNLVNATHQIRHGNYSVRAEVRDEAEVGHLAEAFNEMAASLKAEAVEHDRLLEELRTKEAIRTNLLNKLFSVQEDERRRISRELHDESGQSLASMLAYMKLLSSKLSTDEQRDLLLQVRNVAMDIMGSLRKMAIELRPPILDDLGILTAIRKYIDNYRMHQDFSVICSLPENELTMDGPISLALYRILQESLINIARHASATSVQVSLFASQQEITLSVRDDGKGIDEEALAQAFRNNRLGIFGMRERTELLGGSFIMDSGSERGTTIQVKLPVHIG